MRLPFGLDLMSIVAGMLLAWSVIPWVLGFFTRRKAAA